MEYEVEMFGGSFEPLHIGHIHDMIRAACVCDELHIMISWSKQRDLIPKELRYRWVLNSVKHLPNVQVHLVEDTAATKEEYADMKYWLQGAEDIRRIIGKHIDAVFAGDDYKDTDYFPNCYPDSTIIYYPRKEVPISSTDIRNDVIRQWDYVPQIVRQHYVKKVLIIGGESTGKSTLVQNLAQAYNTNYVEEHGRLTCEIAGGEEYMTEEDLMENLLYQKTKEMEAAKHSNRILFVDTDAKTTHFYGKLLLENVPARFHMLSEAISNYNDFDLIIFLFPTVDFIQDGTRNEKIAANRIKFSRILRSKYSMDKVYDVGGDYLDRFNTAKKLIKDVCGITTQW